MTVAFELSHYTSVANYLSCGGGHVEQCCRTGVSLYKLGKIESGAATNLLNEIDAPIVDRLTAVVK